MAKKFYVTTPIYYPNDKLHIGHAYTTILADYISRYKKMQGYETMFVTGADEHGQKIQEKAIEANEQPIDFVTKITESFQKLWVKLGIENDVFLRTTNKEHIKYVQNSFSDLMKKGFIYKSKYTGLYCKSDEAFYTESQLNNGKCPDCGKDVLEVSEDSYFLKISKFKDWIKNELSTTNLLIPEYRVKELINNFIEELQDLSITRTSFDWGIKINEDDKHVIYVWLDALQNYITALKMPESKFTIEEVWNKNSDVELLQLIGKEIIRFHCIYWPIILKLKDFRMPKILAHGWLVNGDGEKMSKSKGDVVDPIDIINKYGRDALRFYLINNVSTGEDGKFSEELLIETINGLLVNKYSNLIARTDAMINKYNDGVVPEDNFKIKPYEEMQNDLFELRSIYKKHMDNYEFSSSTKDIIKYIELINGLIDKTEPWKKEGEELASILNILIKEIYNITVLLSPILIDSSKKVFYWLGQTENDSFKNIDKDFKGIKLNKIQHLFNRLENK